MKRKWESPKLIVLVRSRPEESILTTCKTYYTAGLSGPGNGDDYCLTISDCLDCAAWADS